MDILILAAGKGTRMGATTVPKCMLPWNGKAMIANVIEAYAAHHSFAIALAHDDKYTEDYLTQAYSNRVIRFSYVPSGERRGPIASTVWALESIYQNALPTELVITVADGIYRSQVPQAKVFNYLGVSNVDRPCDYLNVGITEKVVPFVDKPDETVYVDKSKYSQWSGVCKISAVSTFVDCCNEVLAVDDDNEASYATLLTLFDQKALLHTYTQDFLDLGTKDKYETALAASGRFNYAKEDQITYPNHDSKRVVKLFVDKTDAENFLDRGEALAESGATWVLPKNLSRWGHSVGYDKIPGHTLSSVAPEYFEKVLRNLQRQIWGTEIKAMPNPSLFLLQSKTLARTQKFRETHPGLGIQPSTWVDLLQMNFWQQERETLVCPIHGDLTLDNIVVAGEGGVFGLVDWRTTVNAVYPASAFGDLYYDLAKLWVSIVIDISRVKGSIADAAELKSLSNAEALLGVLREFCASKDYKWLRVEKYGVLLIAAMSGVHQDPYATALYKRSIDLAVQLTTDGYINITKESI